jgi:MoaA/NifB/PqqE/SkfB family radical SAM enzyme
MNINGLYLPWWYFRVRITGKQIPLQTVLFISERCNLSCKHCNVYRKQNPITKSYKQIKEELEYSYTLGSRFVDLEGGEPTLWQDGNLDLNSLIRLSRNIGFYSVTVTTNAINPFAGLEADSIWVSLDGIGAYHDDIRGIGAYQRLQRNIEDAKHPNLSINMVINSRNYSSVEETIRYAAESPYIRSISLNFHNPFPGSEELLLNEEQRESVIDIIIRMKKNGFPVMNSISGLRQMKRPQFKKQCWITNFIMPDGRRMPQCPGKDEGICDCCGLSMSGEMYSVFHLKLDTILAGLKLRI